MNEFDIFEKGNSGLPVFEIRDCRIGILPLTTGGPSCINLIVFSSMEFNYSLTLREYNFR